MTDENVWHLKSAWLEAPSTVNKLLREGYEPFWGYRVVVNGKPKIRMYFRKSPSLVLAAITEARQTEPVRFDLVPLNQWGNQFAQSLNDMLAIWTDRFFERFSKHDERVSFEGTHREIIPEQLTEELLLISDEEPERKEREQSDESVVTADAPSGDGFRVLSDDEPIPVVTTSNRTPQQESTIASLKNQHGVVSILPGNENGAIRVMAGASVYTIGVSGNFTEEATGARTNAM